jgi:hypothetical protein
MCGLQHAALRHAALHIQRQHTVWREMDISRNRIRRMEGRVKLGFLMLQIEKIDGETQHASEMFGIYARKV